MTKPRPQFSILTMLIAVAAVAFILGLRMYIDPRLYWSDLWLLIYAVAFSGISTWLVFAAPWSARIFAIAFVFGGATELLASLYYTRNDLVQFTPGVWTPEGWYPLECPITRLFVHLGWMTGPGTSIPAHFAAMAVSGAAFGVLALAVRYCILAIIFRSKTVG